MIKRTQTICLVLSLAGCAGIQSRYHTVTAGEVLSGLAHRYEVPLAALKKANSLSGDALKPGQKLYIPFEENPDWNKAYEQWPEERNVASLDLLKASRATFIWPVRGRVSSPFGRRYLRGRGRHMHEGIDIAARKDTPVRAARSGHVVYAASRISGYGKMVILQHADHFSTVYAHLNKIKVRKGQFVTRGQLLGAVGRTGRSTGPHLHFEVRARRKPVDPGPFLYQQVAARP